MIIKKSKKIGKIKVNSFDGVLLRYKQYPGQFKCAAALAFKYSKDSLKDMGIVAVVSPSAKDSVYQVFDPSIQKTVSKFTKTSIARGFIVDSTGNVFSVLLQDDEPAQVIESKKPIKEAKSFTEIYNKITLKEDASQDLDKRTIANEWVNNVIKKLQDSSFYNSHAVEITNYRPMLSSSIHLNHVFNESDPFTLMIRSGVETNANASFNKADNTITIYTKYDMVGSRTGDNPVVAPNQKSTKHQKLLIDIIKLSRNDLIHELIHAIDSVTINWRKATKNYIQAKGSNTDQTIAYINNPVELNAHFQALVHELETTLDTISDKITDLQNSRGGDNEFKSLFSDILHKLQDYGYKFSPHDHTVKIDPVHIVNNLSAFSPSSGYIKYLTPDNKKKMLRRLYTNLETDFKRKLTDIQNDLADVYFAAVRKLEADCTKRLNNGIKLQDIQSYKTILYLMTNLNDKTSIDSMLKMEALADTIGK